MDDAPFQEDGIINADFDEVVEAQGFHQLGVLVLDGSPSMQNPGSHGLTKAENVAEAVKDFLQRMKASRRASNFSLAIVTFSDTAKVPLPSTPILSESLSVSGDFNPCTLHEREGGTNIGEALTTALKLSEDHLDRGSAPDQRGIPHSAVVVMMSDGEWTRGVDPVPIADQFRSKHGARLRVRIASTYFNTTDQSNDKAEAVLCNIADTKCYLATYNRKQLRDFFESSVTTQVAIVPAG